MTAPDPSESQLVDAARRAQRSAYSPYSNFRVGAALLDEEGAVHVGCNVENGSLGLTLCAERCAVGAAVAAGRRRFAKIAIVTDRAEPVWPCGACRQVLSEFAPALEVLAVGSDGRVERASLSELLPRQFRLDEAAGSTAEGDR